MQLNTKLAMHSVPNCNRYAISLLCLDLILV